MNALISDARNTFSTARFILLACGVLALAACQTDSTGPAAADAPKAETATAKMDAAAPKPEAAKPPVPASEPEEPMTHARAARECWMRTEKANAREDLDKRADLVNKCIDEKMKAAAAPAPKT
jgi:hypothetical protein